MAMNLRLTEQETEALRIAAEEEGRSMHDVIRSAIEAYISNRQVNRMQMFRDIHARDSDLMKRLAQ